VALGLQSGAVEVRRVPTGEVIRRLEFGESVRTVQFSPDGKQLAVGGKTVRLWQEPLGDWLAWRWEHPAPVFALRYSADGEHLVSACLDRQARVFSLNRSETEASPAPGLFRHETGLAGVTPEHCAAALIQTDPLAPLFFGADNRLLTWTAMGELTAWDCAEKRIFRTLEGTCLATRLVQSPSRNWIAVTFPHGSAQFWTPEILAGPSAMSVKHQERICDLAFGPQAEWVMTASADRTARFWQLPQGTPMLSPLMHSREVAHAAVARNGRWGGTAQLDGQLRVWRLPTRQNDMQPLALGLSGRWNICASPRGRGILLTQMAQNGPESAVLLHGEDSHYEHSQLELPGGLVDAAWSAEGDRLATLTRRRGTDVPSIAGHLELRTAATISHPSRILDLSFLPSRLAWYPNGERLVISDTQGGLWQASFDGRQPLTAWATQAEAVNLQDETLVFSASGEHLIRSWKEGRIEVWDVALQRLRFSQDAPNPSRRLVTPSPTEGHLLITESDGKSQVVHLEDGQVLGKPLKHSGGVVAQGFSPDGRWVVTSGHDGCLQIQDWRTGAMICPPLNHADEVFGFCFSADGGWLAAACRDGTFHVWDTQSGAGLLPVESVHEPLFGVQLDKENRWAVLTGRGSTVWIRSLRVLQEATDWSVEELTLLSEATSGLAMDREPPVKLSSAAWQDRMTNILTLRHDYFDP
jgi:WD40 repeat protein